jgi:D-alanyl-D-alanine carboxypeptidase/D-alanyl-D-alanine-endopeptidase (penicillin-binding protein 4)
MDAEGKERIAQNADQPFVPASVTKIVTAWLAMEVLGGDYRFETRFYLDHNRVLYVRGGGDPFLVSEELAKLAPELVAAIGKEPITGIVLDASYYPSDLRIPGIEETDEAYDALNSALAVNFNTIYAVRKGNRVRSAEDQTPITPLAISQFRARGPEGSGRISLAQDPTVSLKYAGELIAAFIDRSRSRTRCSPRTASPIPSISRRGRASAAATASRPAASPRCSTFSRPTPTCSTATTAARTRPAPSKASARWPATPTPQSTVACAS